MKWPSPEDLLVKEARHRLRVGSALDVSARAIGSLIGVLFWFVPWVILGLAAYEVNARLTATEAQIRLLVEIVDELRKVRP